METTRIIDLPEIVKVKDKATAMQYAIEKAFQYRKCGLDDEHRIEIAQKIFDIFCKNIDLAEVRHDKAHP